jgi:hypothetical protein
MDQSPLRKLILKSRDDPAQGPHLLPDVVALAQDRPTLRHRRIYLRKLQEAIVQTAMLGVKGQCIGTQVSERVVYALVVLHRSSLSRPRETVNGSLRT